MKIRNPLAILAAVLLLPVSVALPSPSAAQILATSSLTVARRGHSATQLQDGRILIVGGENAGGIVDQAEIYDPASQTFSLPGTSGPRTDHAALLLPDGRVLITGGRDGNGILNTTEIFNPNDGSFAIGPTLQRARAGHSATVLADGKILLAGGDAQGSSEIYDPSVQASMLGGDLTEPRTLHGAALLKDGRVLIAGGIDPIDSSLVLDSAELFNPQSGTFSSATTTMGIFRGLPILKVLPDGKVQVIGGDADPLGPSWSMEMFNPETASFSALAHLPPTSDLLSATLRTQSRAALISTTIASNPAVQSALSDPQLAELLDRSDHALTEMPEQSQALVSGGVNSQGEVLTSSVVVSSSQATVTTDKFDYPPGHTVTITGAGWQPNETVWMVLHEEPETHPDVTVSSSADDNGNFTNTDFAPAPADLGRTFTLTAVGQTPGRTAQTAFSDALLDSDDDFRITITTGNGVACGGATLCQNPIHIGGPAVQDFNTAQVEIDWGDGTVENSNFTLGTHSGPSLDDFYGSWSGDHTYATGGSKTINATIYHGSPRVNDLTRSVIITVNLAKLELRKSIVPSGDSGLFNLFIKNSGNTTVASASNVVNNGTTGSGGTLLVAGTYSLSETAGTGTSLSNYASTLACVNRSDNSAVTVTNSSVTLGNTGDVVCTFTNTKNGSVTIKKVMVGGTGTFTFTGSPSGTISTNNGTITQTVQPGTFTATETLPAGWVLTSIECSDPTSNSSGDVPNKKATFNVAAGEDVICTFTNTKNGSVTIKKVMVGGTGTFTFSGSPSGTISTNNGTITQSVQPGTFTSTETVPSGWALTGISCSDGDSTGNTSTGVATFNVAAGEDVICTFTNTKNGSVTIKKVMVGGTGTFTFTGSPSGTISTNNGTITQSVQPGTFTSTETVPSGWALTGISCSDTDSTGNTGTATATFNVAAGEDVTCTFTNTKNGSITVKKVMVGGTGTFTFSGSPSGTISTNNGTITQSVQPGTFTSTETVPSGWALTSISCSDGDSTGNTGTATATFNVSAGEDVTCTFTNTKNGSVTIKKVMVGGTGTFTFTGSPSGTISTNNGTLTQSVIPGTYSATETVPTGWVLTSIGCNDGDSTGNTVTGAATFNVGAGEDVTCTFTNTKNGSITIKKVMVGGTGTFTFTGSPSGTISTNNGTVTQSVIPGTYSATETVPTGWTLTGISCSDTDSTGNTGTATATFNVAAGEDVTCTFTNTKKLTANITTNIHNASHGVVTGVTTGITVHDSVTVSGSGVTPTGTVTFSWFTNGNCTGEASTSSSPFSLVSGSVDGTTFTQTPGVGTFGFQANYSGDGVYNPNVGPCEQLTVVAPTPHILELNNLQFVPILAPLPKAYKSPGVQVNLSFTDTFHDGLRVDVTTRARNVANNCANPLPPSTETLKQFSVPVTQGGVDTVPLSFKLFEITSTAVKTAKKAKCTSITLEVLAFSATAVDSAGTPTTAAIGTFCMNISIPGLALISTTCPVPLQANRAAPASGRAAPASARGSLESPQR
jgi:hypothetical protein